MTVNAWPASPGAGTPAAHCMRGACKTVGGKLVAVTVTVDQTGRTADVRVDGDFFIEPAAGSDGTDDGAGTLLEDIGRALKAGQSAQTAIDRHPEVRLVGTDAAAIDTAYARALAGTDTGRAADGSGTTDASVTVDVPVTSDASVTSAISGDFPDSSAGRTPAVPVVGISAAEDARFAARWKALTRDLVVIHDELRSPRRQMVTDEQWARDVAAGLRPPTLRLWEWSSPCVVIGRFQSLPDEVHEDMARAEGFDIVRRCTGGGAMFVRPADTITYSLYAPLWFVDGLDVAASYRLCDRWLVRALAGLGLDVRFSGLNDIASARGKIGGAAQRRFPAPKRSGGGGAVLHHVTLAYRIDAAAMGRILNTSPEKLSDKAVRSAVKRVSPLADQTSLTREQIVAHLLAAVPGSGGTAV